jgi:protein-tyrosine phosphatase
MDIIASTCSGSVEWTSMGCRGSFWNERRQDRYSVMKTEVYWVPGPWRGRLGIVPRPRGGDWLQDEVKSWLDAGLDMVASLLTSEEAAELGLQQEKGLSEQEGLEFRAFPIPDYGVPSSRAEFARFLDGLESVLESGKNVGIHCRQGIGRSSLAVAALLVSAGGEPDEAFRRIAKARGREVPDTDEQRRWVAQIASAA